MNGYESLEALALVRRLRRAVRGADPGPEELDLTAGWALRVALEDGRGVVANVSSVNGVLPEVDAPNTVPPRDNDATPRALLWPRPL